MSSRSIWPGRATFSRFTARKVSTMPMAVCGTSFATSSISAVLSPIHDGSSRPTALRDNSDYGKERNDKTAIDHARPQREFDPVRHYRRLFPRLGVRVRQMDRTVSHQQPQPYFYLSVHRFRLG